MNKLLKTLGAIFIAGALAGFTAAGDDGTAAAGSQVTGPAIPGLHLDGFARETLPGMAMSAAYLSVRNSGGEAMRLTGVELPGLEDATADLHTTVNEDGVSRMRALPELAIPAGAAIVMAPGGVHLMLHGVRLRAGEQLPLRVHFADGRVVELSIPVRQLKAAAGHHHHG